MRIWGCGISKKYVAERNDRIFSVVRQKCVRKICTASDVARRRLGVKKRRKKVQVQYLD